MPSHVRGIETQQDPIKLRNLLNKCQDRLEQQWTHQKVIDFLKPGFDLQSDNIFWSHQSEGFALFISQNFTEYFNLSVAPQEKVYIENCFHILPLLPDLLKNKTYYILLLRQKGIKLFEADYSSIHELELLNVPQSIDEILRYDVAQEYLSARTVSSGRISGGSLYYGQGDLPDKANHKKHIEMFLKEVAKGIDKQLSGQKIPMILAGVGYEQAFYRQCSSYKYILEKGFSNNFGKLDIKEIHELAQDIVQPYFNREIEDNLAIYQNFLNTQKSSTDIQQILQAAYSGRVNTLLVDISKKVMGKIDNNSRIVEIYSSDEKDTEDLLNLAAIHTLQSDAKVYPVSSTETGSPLAAVFRY